jgi:hypothetical protein
VKHRKLKRTRGKAKPVSREVLLAARKILAIADFEANRGFKRRQVVAPAFKQNLAETLVDARDKLGDVSRALERLKRKGSPALQTLASYWRGWDEKKMNWRQRALTMSKLGFTEFGSMKKNSFDRLVERAQRLYPDSMSSQI